MNKYHVSFAGVIAALIAVLGFLGVGHFNNQTNAPVVAKEVVACTQIKDPAVGLLCLEKVLGSGSGG